MHAHPEVYVDIAAIVWHIPRPGLPALTRECRRVRAHAGFL